MKLPEPVWRGGVETLTVEQVRQVIKDTIDACVHKVDIAMLGQPYIVTERVVRAINTLKGEVDGTNP